MSRYFLTFNPVAILCNIKSLKYCIQGHSFLWVIFVDYEKQRKPTHFGTVPKSNSKIAERGKNR